MTKAELEQRLTQWNETLRENITHIAGQLVERTAECAELRRERDKWCGVALFGLAICICQLFALASLVAGVW